MPIGMPLALLSGRADAGMAVQAIGRVVAGQVTDCQPFAGIDAVVGGHGAVAVGDADGFGEVTEREAGAG
jgi:hypothetical protein